MKKMWNIAIEPNVLPGVNIEPILGEMAWHSITKDSTILDVSRDHLQSILMEINTHLKSKKKLKILEVAAYSHITGYMLNKEIKAEVTLCDISLAALTEGYLFAKSQGFDPDQVRRVACDFHDLPFESNLFDLVYIASAVHHTWQFKKVLSELERVATSNGLIILENEPIRRSLCLYSFRTNRPYDFTDLELSLNNSNLLSTIAEPYFGSRSEQLFGMTENQEMKLEDIYSCLNQNTILDMKLNPKICMGELEKEIDKELITNKKSDANQVIFDSIILKLNDFRKNGITFAALNSIEPKIHSLITKISRDLDLERYSFGCISKDQGFLNTLRNINQKDESFLEVNRSLLFGASLRLVVKKKGESEKKLIKQTINSGVIELGFAKDLNNILDNADQIFPNLQNTDFDLLANSFGTDFDILKTENDITIVTPRVKNPKIYITHESKGHLIISVRVYGVVFEKKPFSLGLFIDGELRSKVEFLKNDSALLVASCSNAISPLQLTFKVIEGEGLYFNISYLSVLSVD